MKCAAWAAGEGRDPTPRYVMDDLRKYCLYCLHTLGAAERCPACGHYSRPRERLLYWNRLPWLIRIEKATRSLSCLGCIFLCLCLLGAASGPGAGYLFVIPIPLYFAISRTVAKLTKHEPYFRPSIVWAASAILLGVVLGVFVSPWFLLLALLSAPVYGSTKLATRWKLRLMRGPSIPSTDNADTETV